MEELETLRDLLRKARDYIEFSPTYGIATTRLVNEIDAALEGVPRTGMWNPEIGENRGGFTVEAMVWKAF